MARYVGKYVELQTADGTCRGTVCTVQQGKVVLEGVEFVNENGVISSMSRIRINQADVINKSIRILDDRGAGCSINDPLSMYNQAEERLAAPTYSERNSRQATFSNRNAHGSHNRSTSQPRQPAPRDVATELSIVFPPDEVFELEQAQHETKLLRVTYVRDMNDYNNYCVLNDPNDRNFMEAINVITSGTIDRVGLGIFGSPLSRTARPAWIAVSTLRGIFLFDVRFMNVATFASCGLAEFLSRPGNELPRKIMHDSRCAADSLRYCFNVQLEIFCDTLALKTCIYMRDSFGKVPRNAWNIFDLLYEYTPSGKDLDLLEHRFDFAQFESDIWNGRPPKASVFHLATALTVHLCDLYDCLMKAYLEPVHYASGIVLSSFRNGESAPFTTKEALQRMPDGIAELAGVAFGNQSQYVANDVGQRGPTSATYKKGLVKRGMGFLVASTTSPVYRNGEA